MGGQRVLREVCEAARQVAERGLVLGSGGNVSARVGDVVYISPSGAALHTLTPDHLVPVSWPQGIPLQEGCPSSELPMHLACYRARAEAQVVIHCHPPHAIALSTVADRVPALTPEFFIYMESAWLPVVAYRTPGTEALAEAVAQALQQAPVAVLANHGLVAVGQTAEQALRRALLAEETARMYLLAHLVGKPRVLDEAAWEGLREAGYGVRPPSREPS